jgi:hypothetical protein
MARTPNPVARRGAGIAKETVDSQLRGLRAKGLGGTEETPGRRFGRLERLFGEDQRAKAWLVFVSGRKATGGSQPGIPKAATLASDLSRSKGGEASVDGDRTGEARIRGLRRQSRQHRWRTFGIL